MSLPYYVPPEQLMKDRAEYARKGIARGRAILAIEYADGVLLIGENPSGALHKISEIYDRIAFAGVGKYNEFESLRVAGIRHADIKGYAYGRSDVAAKTLASAYSQTLGQVFTHEIKPFEVEIFVVEVGEDSDDTRIFRVTYDGNLYDERNVAVIGGESEALLASVQERFSPGMSLAEAIRLGASLFEDAESKSVAPDAWEAAVLDRTNGRRFFRRLTADEIAIARS